MSGRLSVTCGAPRETASRDGRDSVRSALPSCGATSAPCARGTGRAPSHERGMKSSSPPALHLRVPGEHLLGQRRARAEHAADEDRAGRRPRRGVREAFLREGRDQLVDECLLPPPVVEHRARTGALAAVPVGGGIRLERLIVGAACVERPAEREGEARPVGRRRAGPRERLAQSADERIVGARHAPEIRVARQALRALRVDGEELLVGRDRVVALAQVGLQVGEVEERRDVAWVEQRAPRAAPSGLRAPAAANPRRSRRD